ncbi:helix-turn-helix domain-containing protein [Frigoribacterium sp. PvP120]
MAAALEAFIRDEVARQVGEQLALHVNAIEPPAQPANPDDVRWLTTREAAVRVGRHEDTVRKACQTGELFAKQRGKHARWAIRPSSLDAWMDGTPDPHREAVERWQRGPKQPLKPRRPRRPPSSPSPEPEGPAAA